MEKKKDICFPVSLVFNKYIPAKYRYDITK